MNELWLMLLVYIRRAVGWARTYLPRQKLVPYISSTKYFKKGDLVETPEGNTGRVWRVYIKIKTGKPVGCSVVWDEEYKGEKITPFIPIEDKSPKFNPIIRQSA